MLIFISLAPFMTAETRDESMPKTEILPFEQNGSLSHC